MKGADSLIGFLKDSWLWIWIALTIGMSVAWGMRSGCINRVNVNRRWYYFYEFTSNFVGSLAGWCCILVLGFRISKAGAHVLNGIDIFLFLTAIVGISGRLAETIHRSIDAIGKLLEAVTKKVAG